MTGRLASANRPCSRSSFASMPCLGTGAGWENASMEWNQNIKMNYGLIEHFPMFVHLWVVFLVHCIWRGFARMARIYGGSWGFHQPNARLETSKHDLKVQSCSGLTSPKPMHHPGGWIPKKTQRLMMWRFCGWRASDLPIDRNFQQLLGPRNV